MKKATITYTAAKGEAKTLDIAGTTLVSGKSEVVICDDDTMLRLSKAGGMIKVDNVSDYTPPKEPAPKETEKQK